MKTTTDKKEVPQTENPRVIRPYTRAVEFAARLVPEELAERSTIRFALSELCLDSRFLLQRISIEGVGRAEGLVMAYVIKGCSREHLLELCYRVLADQALNEPIGVTPQLNLLREKQKLLPFLVLAVGALGLALQCSDNFKLDELIVTQRSYEKWIAELNIERNGVDTPRC